MKIKYVGDYDAGRIIQYEDLKPGQYFISADHAPRMKTTTGYIRVDDGSMWNDGTGMALLGLRLVSVTLVIRQKKKRPRNV